MVVLTNRMVRNRQRRRNRIWLWLFIFGGLVSLGMAFNS